MSPGEEGRRGTSKSTGGAEQNQCVAQSHDEAGFGRTPHPRSYRDTTFPASPPAYVFRNRATLQLRARGKKPQNSQGEFPFLEPSLAVPPLQHAQLVAALYMYPYMFASSAGF